MAETSAVDYLHISTVNHFFTTSAIRSVSSWAVYISSSSSSSEPSELLITTALRACSSSRTDRSLSDRKQTSGQINPAPVKVLTRKCGPNRLITMCRLLESGVLVVTHTSFRISCLRPCALAHPSCLINTGLEHIQLTWEHGEHDSKPVCFLASTWKSALSLVLSFGDSSWISLRSCSSPSCFHVACLSNCSRILTTRDDTDWSHGGTFWSFAVLTYYITAHMWDVTSAACVKLPRAEKACC